MCKKYSKKYVGKNFTTKEGYEVKVIDCGSKKGYCTIQINNWIAEVQVINLKKKSIRYPFHPTVCNIGYIGIGNHKSKINGKLNKSYSVWRDMIRRCYDHKYRYKNLTYVDCIVSDEWHNYQNFANWFGENYVEGWHLDKDILIEGNKIYSPKTCVFIPQWLNSFMTNNKKNNNTGYIGVSKDKDKYLSKISNIETGKGVRLGIYDTKKEAGEAYDNARTEMVKLAKEKARENNVPNEIIVKIR